jgi:N-methylhydantoinase A
VRVDGGRLIIGPERLGPAMAFGGPEPTPTDAMVWLGLIDKGDRERAAKGIGGVAAALQKNRETAAQQLLDDACRIILSHAEAMVQRINRKPVYTVHEYLEGYRLRPRQILVLGGPARQFARRIEKVSAYTARAVPDWQVANAIGAALARTTCEVALFVDTEQKLAIAPEEDFLEHFSGDMNREAAVVQARALLTAKALKKGADPRDLEIEMLENQQFNMVRGFHTTGKNIRIRMQIKPGRIRGYGDSLKRCD